MKLFNLVMGVMFFSFAAFAQSETGKKNFELIKEKSGHLFYEGKDYKTVKIGKQVWLAENLNYKAPSSKGSNICAGCSDFGRLYTWNSAMAIEPEVKKNYEMETRAENRPISPKHQGICPTGWHIPTINDMRELLIFINVKALKDDGSWKDYFLDFLKDDIEQFIFPRDGGRSTSALQTMMYNGKSLCEQGWWERAGNGEEICENLFGLNIRSSGTGEYRELEKCDNMLPQVDFDTGKRLCCNKGCAGDHFAMWLAEENTICQDKVQRGRHSCVYEPKAAVFKFEQWNGAFFQDIGWEYKNSYASVRCVKD